MHRGLALGAAENDDFLPVGVGRAQHLSVADRHAPHARMGQHPAFPTSSSTRMVCA